MNAAFSRPELPQHRRRDHVDSEHDAEPVRGDVVAPVVAEVELEATRRLEARLRLVDGLDAGVVRHHAVGQRGPVSARDPLAHPLDLRCARDKNFSWSARESARWRTPVRRRERWLAGWSGVLASRGPGRREDAKGESTCTIIRLPGGCAFPCLSKLRGEPVRTDSARKSEGISDPRRCGGRRSRATDAVDSGSWVGGNVPRHHSSASSPSPASSLPVVTRAARRLSASCASRRRSTPARAPRGRCHDTRFS